MEPDLAEVRTGIPQPRFSPGFLACLPLFAAYELGLAVAGASMGRNSAELLLTAGLRPLGAHAALARWLLLAVLLVAAGVRARHLEPEPGRRILVTLAQGFLAALVLGPVLIGLVSLLGVSPLAMDLGLTALPPSPSLAQVGRVMGAAVWEELLYRVLCYAILYLLVVRLASFFTAPGALGHLLADLVAILGSSLAFAAFHLASFTQPLGWGGEAFDGPVFLWRLLAGILLAGLYRWRGLGVAAWAHGLFNLALLLGADPRVFHAGS